MADPIVSRSRARAARYLFFARLFREAPTRELLEAIVRDRLLPQPDPRWPGQAEAIAVEFARLFVVPGEAAVRPYESVYRDPLAIDTSTACSAYFGSDALPVNRSGFLHGPSCVAVREACRQAGFELDPASHELPDHLAIELELMGRLLERGDVGQANAFFTEHLGRWVFRCLGEITQKVSGGFYRALAESLMRVLRHEHGICRRASPERVSDEGTCRR